MDRIAVCQINGGDGDGADIVFDYNGNRISVSILPSSPSQDDGQSKEHQPSTEDRVIGLLDRATSADINDDEYEEIEDEVIAIILDAGKTAFAGMPPSDLTVRSTNQDLHSLLYPRTFTFRLLSAAGKVSIVSIDSEEAYSCPEARFDRDFECDLTIDDILPQYSSEEISIQEIFVQGGTHAVCRVLVDGKEMLCKAWGKGLSDLNLERELAKLQKIRTAYSHSRPPVRVPQLLGYVKHPEAGCILGLLREWVPGCRLKNADIAGTVQGRRREWASQIRETVRQLHKIDVFWGDGKASNVIIDKEDNAWLIDFGGGWTEGWVDGELADTVEGDEQAVERIMKFLGIE